MKKCTKCKVERKLEFFSRRKSWNIGRVSVCRFCQSDYEKKKREQRKLDNIYSF